MLKIRAAQMNALGDAQWKLLAERLQGHLLNTLPGDYHEIGESTVQRLSERCVSDGRDYGFQTDLEFFRLFNIMILIGEETWSEPWVKRTLTDFYTQPPERIKALENECRARGKWS